MRYLQFRVALCAAVVISSGCTQTGYDEPTDWKKLVPVAGMEQPVPEHWLKDEEARIAYSLKLPASVPKAVAFDFDAARWRSLIPGSPDVAAQYIQHLCTTEAGEWKFATVSDVEGLYFARPQAPIRGRAMEDPYVLEMPWIQRNLYLVPDRLHDQGAQFVNPPFYNYKFVEQPMRQVSWQASIADPYVRIFGFTQEPAPDQYGKATMFFRLKTPMQVTGIAERAARFGYTWRGLKRPRDREHGIAGGEILIYDLNTRVVLAIRRQFLIARPNRRGEGKAMWEIASRCPKPTVTNRTGEFTQFAFDVLKTTAPSQTGVAR